MWKAEKLYYGQSEYTQGRAYKGEELVWIAPTTLIYKTSDNQQITPYNTSGLDAVIIRQYSHYDTRTRTTLWVMLFDRPLTRIDNDAFYNKYQLTYVGIPATVTTIDNNAFKNCTGLTKVDFPSALTTLDNYAFSGCRNITSVDLSETSLTSIGDYVFEGCTIADVKLPSTLTTVGDYAFDGCHFSSLPSSITTIGNHSFSGCSFSSSVELPSSLTTIGRYAFSDCTDFSYELPSSLTAIGDYAFYGCGYTSVNIPANVTSIGTNPFINCVNLESITVDSNNAAFYDGGGNCIIYRNTDDLVTGCSRTVIPSTVVNINDDAFYNVAFDAPAIVIPESVRSIGNSFMTPAGYDLNIIIEGQYTNVEMNSFYLISGNTMTIAINSNYYDDYMYYTTVSDWSYYSQYMIAYMKYSATQQVEPASGTDFGTGVNYLGVKYFNPDGYLLFNKPPTKIGASAFSGKFRMTSIEIPSTVINIGQNAFYNNRMTSVTFNDGIQTIDANAFYTTWGKLTTLVLPSTVTSIGQGAFIIDDNGIVRLRDITIYATTPPALTGGFPFAFQGSSQTMTIYVPAASLTAYQTTGVWGSVYNNYPNIYQPIQ